MQNKFTRIGLALFFFISVINCTVSQTPSSNKQTVRRYFEEIINMQKIALAEEIFAQDYLSHSLDDTYKERGIKQVKDFLPYLFKAFPDIHYTIEQILAEENKVVVHATVTGTQKEEFWGYPTSNKKIKLCEIFFFTLKDNKIIEQRGLLDFFHLDKQLSGKD